MGLQWTDKIDGVSDAVAEDINSVAHAIIDLEETVDTISRNVAPLIPVTKVDNANTYEGTVHGLNSLYDGLELRIQPGSGIKSGGFIGLTLKNDAGDTLCASAMIIPTNNITGANFPFLTNNWFCSGRIYRIVYWGNTWHYVTTQITYSLESPSDSQAVSTLRGKEMNDKITGLQNAKADVDDVLTKANTDEYTPVADYSPATKKYVDDTTTRAFNVTDYTAEDTYIALCNHDDARLSHVAMSSLTVSLYETPNNDTLSYDYEAYLSFLSAESGTAWSLSKPDNVTVSFRGADCDADSNTFTPRPNTVYELGLKCIGTDSDNRLIIAVRVGDVS